MAQIGTIIVARYNEDLKWITKIPREFNVYVVNKGPKIMGDKLLDRIDKVIQRENSGREADSYLSVLNNFEGIRTNWLVFAQGDPFPHSPDFLGLLKSHQEWTQVQPLTAQYLDGCVPPRYVVNNDRGTWIGKLRVRKEIYSLRSWEPVAFVDEGIIAVYREYLNVHGLPAGSNIAEHFLKLAGLPDLARTAGQADFGRFAYGAMFAIKSDLCTKIPKKSIEKLLQLANGHPVHGYILERLWLHFFGEAFITLEGNGGALLPSNKVGKIARTKTTNASVLATRQLGMVLNNPIGGVLEGDLVEDWNLKEVAGDLVEIGAANLEHTKYLASLARRDGMRKQLWISTSIDRTDEGHMVATRDALKTGLKESPSMDWRAQVLDGYSHIRRLPSGKVLSIPSNLKLCAAVIHDNNQQNLDVIMQQAWRNLSKGGIMIAIGDIRKIRRVVAKWDEEMENGIDIEGELAEFGLKWLKKGGPQSVLSRNACPAGRAIRLGKQTLPRHNRLQKRNKSKIPIFATATESYAAAAQKWLVESLAQTEPGHAINLEVLKDIGGVGDFQSVSFKEHNLEKNKRLVAWIMDNIGGCIFVTDCDIIYFRSFLQAALAELGNADIALANEGPAGGYNMGQMVIRCSVRTAQFFEQVGFELQRGAWDQQAINDLLNTGILEAKMLSLRFANTGVWEELDDAQRAECFSYHATDTAPRNGRSSLQRKQDRFDEVLAWRAAQSTPRRNMLVTK